MAASLGAGSMALLEMPARAAGVRTRARARAGSSPDGRTGEVARSINLSSASSVHRGDIVGLSTRSTWVRQPQIPQVQRQIVCAATKDLGQQMKEMAAAEKRWQSQVRDGKVKSLSPKEAGYAIDLSDFILLDVRPSSERNRAWVKGSVWIPIFELNRHVDPGTLVSKFSNFAMGGWWSGAPLMDYNGRFMPDVVSKIPKGANVIVACQKGLRSLAACEGLYKAGYRNLFWINGGFDAVDEGDLTREGPDPYKFAGLGGVSKFLGWTDVQREASRKEGWGFRAITGMASSNEWESRRTAPTDLLVVGPGVLGSLVAQLWLKDNEGSLVVGQTNTTVHHENLKPLGILPIVKDSRSEVKFPNVIFCAPPSGSSDYPAEIRAAAQKWNGEGTFLFTSSSGVYDVADNALCHEGTVRAVSKGKSPRTDRLLDAEAEVLTVGGNVVRLAGLYSFDRGPHMFYLSKETVESRPDHLLNLIHYEDAASLCVAVLRGGSRGEIYMGCDNVPISRQEMMDAVNASGKFEQKFSEFTGVDGPLGKKMNNDVTRRITHWTPKYESFPSFLGITDNTFSEL